MNTANLAGNAELSSAAKASLESGSDPSVFYLNLKYNIQIKETVILLANERDFKIKNVLKKRFEPSIDYAGAGQFNKSYQTHSKEKLTQQLSNEFDSGKKYVFIMAIFYYKDVFNIKHRTRVFAWLRHQDNEFFLGTKYNDSY